MTSHADDKAPVKDGDIVLLEYDLWSDTGGRTELVDTTHEDVARDAKIPIPDGATFGPRAHLVGGDEFPSSLEKAIVGAKVGETLDREFPPAEAFGERDPKLIELFSMHEISRLPEMRKDDAELDVGTVLTIGGRQGRVVTLTAARVRVDFNPRLAGRKITAKFHVVERVHAPAEQARALIELVYGRSKEFDVSVEDGTVTIKIPERSKFDFNWTAAKPRVIDRIRTQLKPQTIRVVEEYATPTPPKERAGEKAKDSEKAKDADSSVAKSGGHAHAHAHAPKAVKNKPAPTEPSE
jgi:FKBP-type peptidyl-prolyl cis-trans isomerase 2